MKIMPLISVQLYNWSEYYARIIYFISLSTTESFFETTCYVEYKYNKRIFNRALQTLWEIRLSLFSRTRSWTKILLIYKFSKNQTSNDLCSINVQNLYREWIKKLSNCKKYFRRDKQSKPRVTKAQRIIVREGWKYQLMYLQQQWWLQIWLLIFLINKTKNCYWG